MRSWTNLLAIPFLVSCASQSGNLGKVEAHRTLTHIAWLEGNVESDFEPNRKIASEKLQEIEDANPDSNDTDSYLNYLSVLDASPKNKEAEKKIKEYLQKNPNEKRAVFLLGIHYMRAKKKELANHFFSQLEKDASFPWKSLLYNNLGMLSLQEKDRNTAMGYFEKAVQAQPPIAAPYVNLGAMYLQSRSYGQAQELFKKAIQLDEEFEDAHLGLGFSLEGLGKFEEAYQTYSNYADANASSLSVLYNASLVLGNALKRKQEASEMMLRYIQKGGKETAKAHEMIQGWR